MSEGKRNHFIPKFLLNRFATPKDRKKKYFKIWELGKDSEPRFVSTRNAALASHFYGGVANGLEEALSKDESLFAEALRSIDDGVVPNKLREVLSKFLWLQTIRTRALRLQFERIGDLLIEELKSSDGVSELSRRIRNQAPSEIEKLIQKFPEFQRKQIRKSLQNPQIKKKLDKFVEQRASTNVVSNIIGLFEQKIRDEQMFEKAAESGQLRGLLKLLDQGGVPAHFSPDRWAVIRAQSPQVLLGDICTIAVSDLGETGSVLKFGKRWREIYLPIRFDTVLVAQNSEPDELLSIDAINAASAAHSIQYVYAKSLDDIAKGLIPTIGSRAEVLTKSEMQDIVYDSNV